MNHPDKKHYAGSFDRILNILRELRLKCPWDQQQTYQSLRPQTIEEVYELSDAILADNPDMLKEELGDLLLHTLFYARIAEEDQRFTIHDVIESLCNKLVHRHPHIYEQVVADSAEVVKKNWEQNKIKAGKQSLFSGVPKSAPAMAKANIIQSKARSVGFDWDNVQQVLAKVKEEIQELEDAIASNDVQHIQEEMGDALFSMINLSRFMQVDPEEALNNCNNKFIQRFQKMEAFMNRDNKEISNLSLHEMDIYWEEAKQSFKD